MNTAPSPLSRFATSILAHFLPCRNPNIQQTWKKIFPIFGGSGKNTGSGNEKFGHTEFLKFAIVMCKIFRHIMKDKGVLSKTGFPTRYEVNV